MERGHDAGNPVGGETERCHMAQATALLLDSTCPRTDCRLAQSPLFGQRHLELDSRQLLGELADALQKRQPARVELDVGEQGLDCNLSQSNRWKNFVVTGGHSSN